jgi:hypothetical protein
VAVKRLVLVLPILFVAAAFAAELPEVPVGLDAYRLWHLWPQQRVGVRAYMRSTYDRTGGNRTADASHYLYQESDTFNVPLDVAGEGVLYFVRHNHWHGSPWTYEVDGERFVIQESSTADAGNPVERPLFPGHPMPELAWSELDYRIYTYVAQTKRGW